MTSFFQSFNKQDSIAIVGLGYVGLPLAVEFGKKMHTLGVDLSTDKVESFRRHIDPTGEVSTNDLQEATQLKCYTDPVVLEAAKLETIISSPALLSKTIFFLSTER